MVTVWLVGYCLVFHLVIVVWLWFSFGVDRSVWSWMCFLVIAIYLLLVVDGLVIRSWFLPVLWMGFHFWFEFGFGLVMNMVASL